MAFTQLQGLDPELQQKRRDVIEQSQVVGIDSATLPPITGVYKWEQLLKASQSNDGTAPTLAHYMKSMGYLPESSPRLTGAQGLDPDSLSGIRAKIVRDLISGTIDGSIFTRNPQESVRALTAQYPELSKSHAQLLRAIVSQEIRLEQLDVSHLERQFSFPVTQYNYFGRFLAGGDATPQRAARHLQIANPFLIRMRSLLEGLSNNRLNFLHLNISSTADRQNGNSGHTGLVGPDERRKRVESYRSTTEILHAVINNSADFYGAHRPNGKDPLVCITVPKIPDVNTLHIDKRKHPELAVALFDWLL